MICRGRFLLPGRFGTGSKTYFLLIADRQYFLSPRALRIRFLNSYARCIKSSSRGSFGRYCFLGAVRPRNRDWFDIINILKGIKIIPEADTAAVLWAYDLMYPDGWSDAHGLTLTSGAEEAGFRYRVADEAALRCEII